MLTVQDRAVAVLASVGQVADSRAASGRYRRSAQVRPGVRFWSTSRIRQAEDLLGVQFHGPGLEDAARLKSAFLRAGFEERNPETSKVTFARAIPFAPDDRIDVAAVETVKRQADTILDGDGKAGDQSGMTFLEFMQASPWAGIELDIPPRVVEPERPVDFND